MVADTYTEEKIRLNVVREILKDNQQEYDILNEAYNLIEQERELCRAHPEAEVIFMDGSLYQDSDAMPKMRAKFAGNQQILAFLDKIAALTAKMSHIYFPTVQA